MKLETAYRKLYPHRYRWKITIYFNSFGDPKIEASLYTPSQWPTDKKPDLCFWGRGLASAMYAAVEQIERHNRFIDAYLQYKEESTP